MSETVPVRLVSFRDNCEGISPNIPLELSRLRDLLNNSKSGETLDIVWGDQL